MITLKAFTLTGDHALVVQDEREQAYDFTRPVPLFHPIPEHSPLTEDYAEVDEDFETIPEMQQFIKGYIAGIGGVFLP